MQCCQYTCALRTERGKARPDNKTFVVVRDIMSFAIMPESPMAAPTKAQLYLDTILDELVAQTGREDDRYSFAKVLFKVMKDHPDDIRQIEGSSGVVETNRIVLERSIRTALALQKASVKPGDVVVGISRNHVEMSASYFGPIFAGVPPFHLPVGVTPYELNHYIKLSEPKVIFTEIAFLETVKQSLAETGSQAKVVVFGADETAEHESFSNFIQGFDAHVQDFRPVTVDIEAPTLIVPTSGSTGFPKAAVLTSAGLVAQIPTFWTGHDIFPTPERLVLVLSNAHWISYTMNLSAAVPYRIPILYTADTPSVDVVRALLRKYKPTFFTTITALCQGLLALPGAQPDDLKCLNYLLLAGSAVPEKTLALLKQHTIPNCRVKTGYGLTELHGGVMQSLSPEPTNSLGVVGNIFLYKIIDEQGNSLGINQPGELCLKSRFKFKGYLKDAEAYKEVFTEDDYFKTGDRVYQREDGEMVFLERIKFLIKYKSHHVYPSELEDVISKVEGVAAAAVCEAERGPAAIVMVHPDFQLTARQIHHAVNTTLSNEKRLRGGVAFVPSIPLSVNNKIDRKQVKIMFQAISESDIYYDE